MAGGRPVADSELLGIGDPDAPTEQGDEQGRLLSPPGLLIITRSFDESDVSAF